MTPQPGLSRRHRVLGFVALATLAASIWALGDDSDVPASLAVIPDPKRATAVRETSAGDAARGAARAALTLPVRYGLAVTRRDLFAAPAGAAASAIVSATTAVTLAPPPPPPAITLPFSFAGRLVSAAGPSVLLNEGATTRVLALGDSLGDFRFEQDSGTQLEFVHLPSGERLVLALQP